MLKAAELGERFDMAVIAGNGYASEACRTLLERCEEGDYSIFVLHDADPSGYEIARTLAKETSRRRALPR